MINYRDAEYGPYKSVGVEFERILEEALNQQSDIVSVNMSALIMLKDDILAAIENLARGMMPQTEGPITVSRFKQRYKFQLVNGYHRAVLAILAGKQTMLARVEGNATWQEPSAADTFTPDWTKRFKGLENFAEIYLLKRI